MTKRILLLFFILAAMILPASAATKAHRHKHSIARSKSKSIRKATRHRTKSVATRKHAKRNRASARRHRVLKP